MNPQDALFRIAVIQIMFHMFVHVAQKIHRVNVPHARFKWHEVEDQSNEIRSSR
ncbi:MAG: hypothetical protein ACOYKA_05800 [Legionellaceae bacterium]